jgi:tRNA(Ile)-lysidine synthase
LGIDIERHDFALHSAHAELRSLAAPTLKREPALHLVTQTLADFLAPRLTQGQRLCVALSGGRDSLVLLHALSRLVLPAGIICELSALHVHHALSPNADAWAEFCANFCRDCGVSLKVVQVAVPRQSGEGLEAAA